MTEQEYIARQGEIDALESSLSADLKKRFVGKYLKVIKEYKWPKCHPPVGRTYKIEHAFVGNLGLIFCIDEYNGFQLALSECEIIENHVPKPKAEKKPDGHIWILNVPKVHICLNCRYVKRSSDRSYPSCAEVMKMREAQNA